MSVIIPWWGDHPLLDVLPANLRAFKDSAVDFYIVTTIAEARSLARRLRSAHLPLSDRIMVVGVGGEARKARLSNAGGGVARSPFLLFCDADVLLNTTTIRRMRHAAAKGGIGFVKRIMPAGVERTLLGSPVASIKNVLEVRFNDGRVARVQRSAIYPNEVARSGPGIICLSRRIFKRVGGYCGVFAGWGWEDVDFLVRCSLACGVSARPVGRGWHDWSRSELLKVRKKRRVSDSDNYRIGMSRLLAGNLDGTYSEDIKAIKVIIHLNKKE
jgi:hypothetical protein